MNAQKREACVERTDIVTMVNGREIRSKGDYAQWIWENEWDRAYAPALSYRPLISVVIPVYNVAEMQLRDCIESVRQQTYQNWELILVDDCSSWPSVRENLREYEGVERIRIIYREKNGNISEATNTGIEAALGEFLAFADCDDILAENALYEVAKILNEHPECDFIYSDEDKLTEDGEYRHDPFFKPDWSPDTFWSLNYTNHLSVFRTELVKEIGGLRSEFNGSQDYDFTLRFMEVSDNKRVFHIPKVLYHWRERSVSVASNIEAKPYTLMAAKRAKEEALERRGISGTVEKVKDMYQYRVVFHNEEKPLVSIIIPSKDNLALLTQCIDSIYKHVGYPNFEIVVVDNGSANDVRRQIEEYIQDKNVIYHYEKMTFNFSHMCNMGAALANGDFYLFLNDDIEVLQDDWLDILVGQASQSYAGAVGAKLYYPNSLMIQHDGVVVFDVGPVHAFYESEDCQEFYYGRNRCDYNYLAVTGACLLVAKEKFQRVGGFDEQLAVTYNDVELCMRLYMEGYYNCLRNDVILYHHESVSRGDDAQNERKMKRLVRERERLFNRYPKLCSNDPFYNPNLTRKTVNFGLNLMSVPEQTGICRWSNLTYMESTAMVNIDAAGVYGSYLVIGGWAIDELTFPDNDMEKAFLLKGINGQNYVLPTKAVFRQDVIEVFASDKNSGARYGFHICVRANILNLELMDYEVICLLSNKEKTVGRYVSSSLRKMLGRLDSIPQEKEYFRYEEELPETAEELVYYIDKAENQGMEYCIEGWSYVPYENDEWMRQIMLLTEEGTKFLFDIERTERIDVAANKLNVPFILYCGFKCKIGRRVIERLGNNIRVGMLLTNIFDDRKKKSVIFPGIVINANN